MFIQGSDGGTLQLSNTEYGLRQYSDGRIDSKTIYDPNEEYSLEQGEKMIMMPVGNQTINGKIQAYDKNGNTVWFNYTAVYRLKRDKVGYTYIQFMHRYQRMFK